MAIMRNFPQFFSSPHNQFRCYVTRMLTKYFTMTFFIYTISTTRTQRRIQVFMKEFQGVGICIVNLVDDMQEYTRGLFLIM